MRLTRRAILGLAGGAGLSVLVGGFAFAATATGAVQMELNGSANCWYSAAYSNQWYTPSEEEYPSNVSYGGTVTASLGGDYNTSGGDDYMAQIAYKTAALTLDQGQYGAYGQYSGTKPTQVIEQSVSNGRVLLSVEWNGGTKQTYPGYGYVYLNFKYTGGSSYHWDNTFYNNGADLAYTTYGAEDPCSLGQFMPYAYTAFGPASNPLTIYDPPSSSTASSPVDSTASGSSSLAAQPNPRTLPHKCLRSVPWIFKNSHGKTVGRFTEAYVMSHRQSVEKAIGFKF